MLSSRNDERRYKLPPLTAVTKCPMSPAAIGASNTTGTCRVLITKGMENASPMGLLEKIQFKCNPPALFAYIGNEDSMRLACRTKVMGDMDVVTRPPMNLTGDSFFS